MNMCSFNCCNGGHSTVNNKISSLSALLKLIGDENRLKILCILRSGEHCVCEIIGHLQLSQTLISHHLKDLKDAQLVDEEKRGRKVYYWLTDNGKNISNSIFKLGERRDK